MSSDALPFHMDRLQESMLYMNVRLPKRSRQVYDAPRRATPRTSSAIRTRAALLSPVPVRGMSVALVRLPREREKIKLLRDPSKRRAVIFPMAGEIVRVHYSSQLSAVWNPNREFVVSLRITKLLPRAAGAATASVFAIRE